MEISEALKLFNIEDISKENDDSIKKTYRKLSRLYHPDSCKDNGNKFKALTEAYNILKDLLKQVKILQILNNIQDEKIIQITLEDIIQIYRNGKSNNINKVDLYKNRVLVMFSVNIEYDSVSHTHSTVNLWNVEDRYEIQINTSEKDIASKRFKLNIMGIQKDITVNSNSIQFIITLDYNIKVSIIINRKVKVED